MSERSDGREDQMLRVRWSIWNTHRKIQELYEDVAAGKSDKSPEQIEAEINNLCRQHLMWEMKILISDQE